MGSHSSNEHSVLAAVDLGSNSFHLQVGRVVDDQIYPFDSLKETVRLGAGLTSEKRLDETSQERALECLKRFGERLHDIPVDQKRAVGTNTLRVAKNAKTFLKKAEFALGFPIEVIAGVEEARLIYLGVSHSLPLTSDRRLVVDIGGGSTEIIIGHGLEPFKLESLYMGCVGYSLKFFRDGKISKNNMTAAELAAQTELQPHVGQYSRGNWHQAVGSSGTARAICEALQQNKLCDDGISAGGLEALRTQIIKLGHCTQLGELGVREDRSPVFPGGVAIMTAIFSALGISHMNVADGAMREGILYDLLGRAHHHDMRDSTVDQFMRRYHVVPAQAKRVAGLAQNFLLQMATRAELDLERLSRLVLWAAYLHEIGLSVAHSGYHKHSAYIIKNADMPGFSKMEQEVLSLILLAHRGSLKKMQGLLDSEELLISAMALRLAAIFYRGRRDRELPDIRLTISEQGTALSIDQFWLADHPMTSAMLENEIGEWSSLGVALRILSPDTRSHAMGSC